MSWILNGVGLLAVQRTQCRASDAARMQRLLVMSSAVAHVWACGGPELVAAALSKGFVLAACSAAPSWAHPQGVVVAGAGEVRGSSHLQQHAQSGPGGWCAVMLSSPEDALRPACMLCKRSLLQAQMPGVLQDRVSGPTQGLHCAGSKIQDRLSSRLTSANSLPFSTAASSAWMYLPRACEEAFWQLKPEAGARPQPHLG